MIAERRDDVQALVNSSSAPPVSSRRSLRKRALCRENSRRRPVEPRRDARAAISRAVEYVVDPRDIMQSTKAMLEYQASIGDFATAPPVEGFSICLSTTRLKPR